MLLADARLTYRCSFAVNQMVRHFSNSDQLDIVCEKDVVLVIRIFMFLCEAFRLRLQRGRTAVDNGRWASEFKELLSV
jgi:hypothetical protein